MVIHTTFTRDGVFLLCGITTSVKALAPQVVGLCVALSETRCLHEREHMDEFPFEFMCVLKGFRMYVCVSACLFKRVCQCVCVCPLPGMAANSLPRATI